MAQLGDVLAGAAGSPVNRPALNAAVMQGQAMAGLRTAQTEDALLTAQQMREEQQAGDELEGALMNAKDAQGNNMFTPSQAHFTATQMKFLHGGALPALQAWKEGQAINLIGTVANPNADPNARLAALQAVTGKAQSAFSQDQGQLVGNLSPNAATNPTVMQTPVSTAHTNDMNADANLKNTEAKNPQLFHNTVAGSGGGGMMGLSQQDIDVMGDRYYETGNMPPLGMGQSPLRYAIIQSATSRAEGKRGPVIASTGGTAAGNMIGNAAFNNAQKNGMSAMTRQAGLVGAYETTASANMDLALSYLNRLDSTGSPLINRGLRDWQAGVTGNPDTQEFVLALNTARSEYERVVSGASGAQGITDAARKEGEQMFPNGITPQQLPGVIQAAKLDMANRVAGFQNQLKHTKDLISMGGDAVGAANMNTNAERAQQTAPQGGNAPPVALLKEGSITHFGNGQSWTIRNGVPMQVDQQGRPIQAGAGPAPTMTGQGAPAPAVQ